MDFSHDGGLSIAWKESSLRWQNHRSASKFVEIGRAVMPVVEGCDRLDNNEIVEDVLGELTFGWLMLSMGWRCRVVDVLLDCCV